MAEEILIDETGPNLTQTTELDGVSFIFDFRWNEREQRWYMDIRDSDSNPLFMGRKIVADWILTRLLVNDDRPAGEILTIDLGGGGDPRLGDLGSRVKLIYFTGEEIEAGLANV